MMDKNRKPYRTKDGYVGVLVYNDKHWKRFFAGIGRDDMARDPRYVTIAGRTENIGFLYDFLAETLAMRTTEEWLAFFVETDIPAMRLATPDELLENEHMAAVGFFKTVDHPTEGRVRIMDIPQTWSASQPGIRSLAPRPGQHSAEILASYGFSEPEIAMLLAGRVIHTQETG
jgi:formyl-CoA transferase